NISFKGNFSEKLEDKIKLQSGCQLNNELLIDFIHIYIYIYIYILYFICSYI
ncbi:hypothetical protein PFFVO_04510, partial [Plasmodium falciparum Vietnam Oak-Knoll (FVO)]